MKPKFDIINSTKEIKKNKKVVKSKPIEVPVSLELEYFKFLKFMVEQIKERFLNNVFEAVDTKKVKEVIHDSFATDINKAIREFKIKIEGQFNSDRLLDEIKKKIKKADKNQKYKLIKSINYGFGIDISKIPEFKAYKSFINSAVKRNLSLVTSLKQETLSKLETVLRLSIEKGYSIDYIKKEILKTSDVSKKRAALIARNELKNVTNMLNIKRLMNVGFEEYEWMTAGDERVRGNPKGKYPKAKPSHYIMNGLICRLDDPTVYRRPNDTKWKKRTSNMPIGHAGDPILCRCQQIPYVKLD